MAASTAPATVNCPSATANRASHDRYAEWYWRKQTDPSPKNKTYPIFKKFQDRVYGPNATYQDFANGFTCELFQPANWAEVFKQAGARYATCTR